MRGFKVFSNTDCALLVIKRFFFLASFSLTFWIINSSLIKTLKTRLRLCFLISKLFKSSLNVIPGFRLIIKRHRISAIPRFRFSICEIISCSSILSSYFFYFLIDRFSENLDYYSDYKLFFILFIILLTFFMYIFVSVITKAFKFSDIKLKY